MIYSPRSLEAWVSCSISFQINNFYLGLPYGLKWRPWNFWSEIIWWFVCMVILYLSCKFHICNETGIWTIENSVEVSQKLMDLGKLHMCVSVVLKFSCTLESLGLWRKKKKTDFLRYNWQIIRQTYFSIQLDEFWHVIFLWNHHHNQAIHPPNFLCLFVVPPFILQPLICFLSLWINLCFLEA